MINYFKKLFSNSGEASMIPFAVLLLLLVIAANSVFYFILIYRPDASANMLVINAHISFMEWILPVLLFAVGITGVYEYKSKDKNEIQK